MQKLGAFLENKLKELKDYGEAVDILEGKLEAGAVAKERLNNEFNGTLRRGRCIRKVITGSTPPRKSSP